MAIGTPTQRYSAVLTGQTSDGVQSRLDIPIISIKV